MGRTECGRASLQLRASCCCLRGILFVFVCFFFFGFCAWPCNRFGHVRAFNSGCNCCNSKRMNNCSLFSSACTAEKTSGKRVQRKAAAALIVPSAKQWCVRVQIIHLPATLLSACACARTAAFAVPPCALYCSTLFSKSHTCSRR